MPHIVRFVGEQPVKRPLAYAVPPDVARHLSRHGLKLAEFSGPVSVHAEIARVRGQVVSEGRQILEAAASVHIDVEHSIEDRPQPPNWRVVFTAQQRGAIAVYLCEAGSDDGLLACGLIDIPAPGSEFPAWRVHRVETPR